MTAGRNTVRCVRWWGVVILLLAVLPAFLLLVPSGGAAAAPVNAATPPPTAAPPSTGSPPVTLGAVASPPASLSERGAIVVGGEPKFLLRDASRERSGERLFVSDFAGDRVVVVDLDSGLAVGSLQVPGGPAGLALSEKSGWLFVASYWGDSIYRFDVSDLGRPPLVRFTGGDSCPWDLQSIRGANGREYVAATLHHRDSLILLDPATLDTVVSFPTAWFPYMMDVDQERGLLFAVAYGGPLGGELLCVDVTTLTEMWRVPAGRGAFDVCVYPGNKAGGAPEAGSLFVVDFNGQAVKVFGAGGEERGSFRLEGTPRHAVFDEEGERFFVSLQARGRVAEIASGPREVVGAVSVGSRPGPLAWMDVALPFAPVGEPGPPISPHLVVGNQGDGTLSILGPGGAVAEFTDVPPGHLFARDIRVLVLRGALSGYPPESGGAAGSPLFRPDGPLARAQAAKVVVGALSLHTAEIEPAALDFTDVPPETGTYPFDYVQEAVRAGIVSGVSAAPPRFSPYTPVTRLQLLRMLVRAAEAVGTPLPVGRGPSPFYDIGPAHPDFGVVMTAYRAGLTAGVPGADGRLRLQGYDPATRGQTARMVCNLLAALGHAVTFGAPAG